MLAAPAKQARQWLQSTKLNIWKSRISTTAFALSAAWFSLALVPSSANAFGFGTSGGPALAAIPGGNGFCFVTFDRGTQAGPGFTNGTYLLGVAVTNFRSPQRDLYLNTATRGQFRPQNTITTPNGRTILASQAAFQSQCGLSNFRVASEIIAPIGDQWADVDRIRTVFNYEAGGRTYTGTMQIVESGANNTRGVSFSNVVTPPNSAPTIAFGPDADDDVESGPVASDDIVLTATDPDAGDTLTISYDFVSNPAACVAPLALGNTVSPTGTSPLTTAPIALSSANNGDYVCSAVNDGTETTYQVSANPINIDDTDPRPTITSAPPITTSDPFDVSISFNEVVTDFDDLTDVDVTGGTVTAISGSGSGPYIVTITPTGSDDITVTVPADVAVDIAGRDNVVSNTITVSNGINETQITVVEEVLTEDLLVTTRVLSQSASNISRRAADRLRFDRGQACVTRINELLQSSPIRFASDRFFIDASNAALLDELALEISRCPDATFTIAGHTDSDASDAYNLTLSQNRVDAVKAALVQRGVANDRLQTRGFGESRPIATNATEEGQALNRRVEFILSNEDTTMDATCDSGSPLGGSLDGQSDGENANLAGTFGSEGYNCVTGERTETWGEVSVTHNDDVGTLGLMTFGRSKETQTNNALSGRFVEGYVSRNTVDSATAEGTITGFGVHAGLYRAQALEGGLVLNYYGSAAVGRHSFELDAGTDVDGHYTYAGVFAGAAIGGERAMGEMVLKPKVGVDLAYSKAIGSEISIPGSLDIEPAEYARGFVELGLERATETGMLVIAPRVFCDTKEDDDADACGFGGKVSFESAADATGASWDVAFDYEAIDTLQNASFSVVRSQSVFDGMGVSRSSFGASTGGALQAEQTISFTW